jgi:pyridoxine kinase
MTILTIQSQVTYGYVGNSAAVFPLQRLGFEAWPLNCLQYSNHLGYGAAEGGVVAAADLAAILRQLDSLGVLGRCRALLSGYLGSLAHVAVVADALARIRKANPAAFFALDPVMGDRAQGLYVAGEMPEALRSRVLPAADVIVPNHFELEVLAERKAEGPAQVIEAARHLIALGPKTVLVTSVLGEDGNGEDKIFVFAVTARTAWRVATPLLHFDTAPNGCGDLFAALFLAHSLHGESVPDALSRAVSTVYGILDRTRREGTRELRLIQAQEEIVSPRHLFASEEI